MNYQGALWEEQDLALYVTVFKIPMGTNQHVQKMALQRKVKVWINGTKQEVQGLAPLGI